MKLSTLKYLLFSILFIFFSFAYKIWLVEPCTGNQLNYCEQVYLPDSDKYIALSESKYIFDKQWNTIGISILYKSIEEFFSYFYFSVFLYLISNFFLLKALVKKKLVFGRKVDFFLFGLHFA